MAVTFRKAEAEDAGTIHALLLELAAQDGSVSRGSGVAILRHGFGARPLFDAILADEGGVAVGLVLYYPDYSTLRGEPGVYVQDLIVTQAARGRGLGRALLSQAMAAARAGWGAGYMILYADPGNATAQGFYAATGFERRKYAVLLAEATVVLGDEA